MTSAHPNVGKTLKV